MLKLWDFYCEACDHSWEDLVDDEQSTCNKCNNLTTRLKICAGQLAAFSIKDADGRRQSLLKRSADHTMSELRKQPEKFGGEGIRRARDGQIRSFGGMGKRK